MSKLISKFYVGKVEVPREAGLHILELYDRISYLEVRLLESINNFKRYNNEKELDKLDE